MYNNWIVSCYDLNKKLKERWDLSKLRIYIHIQNATTNNSFSHFLFNDFWHKWQKVTSYSSNIIHKKKLVHILGGGGGGIRSLDTEWKI